MSDVTCSALRLGVVSDTHGVADQEVLSAFQAHKVRTIVHAGDVGSHGGHAEVLSFFQRCANCIAVRGNVDDTASIEELPEHVSQTIAGWEIFVTHIVDPGQGQKGLSGASDRIPDIVIHGHSHKYGVREEDNILFINPGSAGPARFKLPRTAAVLELQPKEQGIAPSVTRIELAAKAPKRIQAAAAGTQKRRRKATDGLSLTVCHAMSTAWLPGAVAEVILRQYESLPKTGKPQPNEHTVLAGFAISINGDFQDSVGAATQPGHARLVPVALGTGTKCVGSRQSRDQIDVINDSHAEVIARRSLMLWLYGELEACQGSDQLSGFSKQDCQETPTQGGPQHALSSNLPAREDQGWHRSCSESIAPLCLFEQTLSGQYRRVGDWRLHMFVSQVPCGDACIFPASMAGNVDHDSQDGWAESTAHHRTGAKDLMSPISGSVQQASLDGGAYSSSVCSQTPTGYNEAAGVTKPKQIDARQPTAAAESVRLHKEQQSHNWEAAQEEGVLRTKPGRGSPTQSLSCSDKMARWCILGVQGALLLQVLEEPLYMSSLTVACTVEPAKHSTQQALSALERAILGRSAGARHQVGVAREDATPRIYVLSHLPAALAEPFTPSAVRSVPSGLSINWHASPSGCWSFAPGSQCQHGVAEATLAASGRKAGTAKTAASLQSQKTRSILCRAALFDRYLSLKAHAHWGDRQMEPVLPSQSLEQQYRRAKTEGEYRLRWQALQSTDSIFSVWYSARSLSSP